MSKIKEKECYKFISNSHENIQIVGIAVLTGFIEYVPSQDIVLIPLFLIGLILILISIGCDKSKNSQVGTFLREFAKAIALGLFGASIISLMKGNCEVSLWSFCLAALIASISFLVHEYKLNTAK